MRISVPAELPQLRVPNRPDAPLSADAASVFWSGVPAVQLADVVTGGAPAQATEVRAAATENALRLLFIATDAYPWATLAERDAPLYTEEVVEVFLDPIGDLAAYFEIEVNPLNAVLDLVIRRTRRGLLKDFRWQCAGLQTLVMRTASGWNTELAIPWRAIAETRPAPGANWRANFCRIDRPENVPRELTAWSPTGQALFHVPEHFGVLQFEGRVER